jgi:hypothetical protein
MQRGGPGNPVTPCSREYVARTPLTIYRGPRGEKRQKQSSVIGRRSYKGRSSVRDKRVISGLSVGFRQADFTELMLAFLGEWPQDS